MKESKALFNQGVLNVSNFISSVKNSQIELFSVTVCWNKSKEIQELTILDFLNRARSSPRLVGGNIMKEQIVDFVNKLAVFT